MPKIVYKAASDFLFVRSLVWRAICVAVLIYLYFQYDQNPNVIIIVGLICLLLLVFIGDEIIIVYEDKVELKSSSIYNLFFKSRSYSIVDIESAEIQQPEKADIVKVSLIVTLISIIPDHRRSQKHLNRFYLNLRNGEQICIESELDVPRLMQVVRKINSLIIK